MKFLSVLTVLMIGSGSFNANAQSSSLSTKESTEDYSIYKKKESLIFKTTGGSLLPGTLYRYDPVTKKAEIKLDSGPRQRKSLQSFSRSDQDYIQNWHIANNLLDRGGLKVTLLKRNYKNRKGFEDTDLYYGPDEQATHPNLNPNKRNWIGKPTDPPCTEVAGYEIKLENRSGTPLSDIWVEYCIYNYARVKERELTGFISTASNDGGLTFSEDWTTKWSESLPNRTAVDFVAGRFSIPQMEDKKTITRDSKRIILPGSGTQETPVPNSFGKTDGLKLKRYIRDLNSKLLGIRCRVYIPKQTGGYIMREFYDSRTVIDKTDWLKGMNK